MQSYEAEHLLKLPGGGNSKLLLPCLIGAGILASLLTGIIAASMGGIVAGLSLVIVVFMVLALVDYRVGILLAAFLLPLSATRLIPRELFGITGFNPLNLTLLTSVVSLFFMLFFRSGETVIARFSRHFWAYMAMLALAALHGSFNVYSIPPFYQILELINFDSAAGYLRDIFLKPMLILATAFLLSIVIRNASRPGVFLIPLFGSALVLPSAIIAYIVIKQLPLSVLASSESRDILSVTGMHANELGLMFNMVLALALFCFANISSTFWKLATAGAILILLAAITLTFSRGAYLGLLVLILYFLYVHRRFSIMFAGMALLPLAILLAPQAVMERATTGAESGNIDALSAGRVDRIWRPLLPEVFESPFIGQGLSSILWSEAAQRGSILNVGHPHSAYLGALMDFGIIGSLVVFVFFRHMWRLFRDLAQRSAEPVWRGFFTGASACILLLLVQGLTDDRFTPTFAQTFLWLAYGAAIGLAARLGPDTSRNRPAT